MDLKRIMDTAKQTFDERGGTDRLKQDAQRLKDIASGPGSAQDKARAAGDALKARDVDGKGTDGDDAAAPGTPPAA
jgi:hypothetical protein